ncbi:hypothetical protein [Streptomyces sp. B21-083]|uniref:hypothetical protein n=1 Tax=Streptomyces sp. B21-083 TaxID=3039410 RepID=UPI002FF05B82
MNKDVQQYLRKIRRQGFAVRISGSGHYLCTAPDGRRASIPATPRGGKAVTGIRATLRQLGARL